MNIEDYKRLHEAMEIPSQGTGSPYRELLEKMFKVVIRLERQANPEMNYDHQAGENGSFTNSYKSEGVSQLSGTLNRLVSDVPNPTDSSLSMKTIKRGQGSSEAILNAVVECYIEGVSPRDNGKIFDHFGIESRFCRIESGYANLAEKVFSGDFKIP